MVKINLNSAELSHILQLIDESGIYNDPYIEAVQLSIVNKINGVANNHNKAMEEYAIDIIQAMRRDDQE